MTIEIKILIHNKWKITRRIGGGSFGEIYMGIGPNMEKVAVKFEKEGSRCPQLRHEYKVYRELVNCHGFCGVYYFGAQDNHNVMVMDLMGPSLEDLFNKCARKFSLKTVLQIADQLLERVDTLHARHLIHRDIKPANFVIGIGDQGANVYCVDFGLSKRYRHPKNLQHIPHRDGRSLTGTPRYASINNHLGIEQSRRDDLEAIAYILIYFLKGSLPWQGLKAKNASKKYMLILSKKQSVSIAQLCQGCPSQFAEFLAYSRSLKFDAKPDIPYLRKIFRDLYNAQGCPTVGKMWDWDAFDSDYLSHTPGSGGTVGVIAPPPILQTGLQHPLRPSTTAAVANPRDYSGLGSGAGGGLLNTSR
jgi:serine/threonine protein kinase